jgi:hypothetical protein
VIIVTKMLSRLAATVDQEPLVSPKERTKYTLVQS